MPFMKYPVDVALNERDVVVASDVRPALKVSNVEVAFDGNGSAPPPALSVQQLNTPAALAFTSQDALLRLETISPVVEAIPVFETWNSVVVADAVEDAIRNAVL
jgi:hypothetical protein